MGRIDVIHVGLFVSEAPALGEPGLGSLRSSDRLFWLGERTRGAADHHLDSVVVVLIYPRDGKIASGKLVAG